MKSQILLTKGVDANKTNFTGAVMRPRYNIPYAKTEILPYPEGTLIYQHYSSYLYYMELFELRLEHKLTLPFRILDQALFQTYMLQGEVTFTTPYENLLYSAWAGSYYASINSEADCLAHFDADTHIIACITPRLDWIRKQKNQFPYFIHGIEKHSTYNESFLFMDKRYIDKDTGRNLMHLWQLSPNGRTSFEKEMDDQIRQLLSGYHDTLQYKDYFHLLSNTEKIPFITEYLKANFLTSDIANKSNLCARFHMSERTLQRAFKNQHQINIHKYVENLRLTHACSLLMETALPIHIIASRSSFQTANYFCRAFSRKYTCSPTVFRKNNRTPLPS
ncbi:helix-turn-helix domain-containing protein [Sphingobacterium haloxyli]|uniref:HTH araC/xylS-type domain-containing protein n=1 Tax=Sphingobacterium haloxyli TaxID=2100533 RepID=A0A2S9J381_9SPHI|nr:response regulator transcription factor [Sphingobacterium haloxyli]PRD47248.1 hypothetical protein C5745_10480 [Sphingobacterium haloxyli]